MNLEFETKAVLREDVSPEKRAKKIIKFATFKENNVVKAINLGGLTASMIYGNLLMLEGGSRRKDRIW